MSANSTTLEQSAQQVLDALLSNNKDSIRSTFEDAFAPLMDTFVRHIGQDYGLEGEPTERLRRMLEYTCIGGKYNRGLLILSGIIDLTKEASSEKLPSNEQIQHALVLAWCVEILQSYFLVEDDVMDHSLTRRGRPCWYRNADVGLDAVNDGMILESFLFYLIQHFGKGQDWYLPVMQLFQDVTLRTEIGQMMDLLSQPQGRKGPEVLAKFSQERMERIYDYKTAYYSFYLPIACAMLLFGYREEEKFNVAKDISVLLGRKFQTQDDYLDCFGDPEHIGKVGTDIQDHKCTWLLIQAMKKANEEQVRVIESNLGKDDADCIARIKQLYLDLDLNKEFDQFEETSYQQIKEAMSANEKIVPPVLFEKILKKIHRRSY